MIMAVRIIKGDSRTALSSLPDGSVHCCVTSPPYYGLRDYGMAGQIGLEMSPDDYVDQLVSVFRQVRRVLRDDGTVWLNLGDSYAGGGNGGGSAQIGMRGPTDEKRRALRRQGRGVGGDLKPKDLIGIPWMVAFALRADGWFLRQDIIWSKPNPMPESVTDRCTKAHEYLFLLSKSGSYYFDANAIKEPGAGSPSDPRNRWDRQDYLIPGQKPQKRLSRAHLPGNKTHKGAAAYEAGDGKMRTKAGLVDYSARVAAHPDQMMVRNRRSVWSVSTKPFREAHFATYPVDLVEPCILAGCPAGGVVLDPFFGAGTTGVAAGGLGRGCIGVELNPDYIAIATARLKAALLPVTGGIDRPISGLALFDAVGDGHV